MAPNQESVESAEAHLTYPVTPGLAIFGIGILVITGGFADSIIHKGSVSGVWELAAGAVVTAVGLAATGTLSPEQ